MGTNEGRRFPADPLTRDEAVALLGAIDTRWESGRRNKAHLAVLWRCGLRIAESCNLDLADFREGDPCSLRVMRPKGADRGKSPRELGLDVQTCELLRDWLEVRGSDPGPIFRTTTGARVHPTHVRRLLPKLAKRAGIARRVHPHALRHTFAREMYDEGVGIVHIQKCLGHDKLQTTATYLSSIGASDVRSATAGREW